MLIYTLNQSAILLHFLIVILKTRVIVGQKCEIFFYLLAGVYPSSTKSVSSDDRPRMPTHFPFATPRHAAPGVRGANAPGADKQYRQPAIGIQRYQPIRASKPSITRTPYGKSSFLALYKEIGVTGAPWTTPIIYQNYIVWVICLKF